MDVISFMIQAPGAFASASHFHLRLTVANALAYYDVAIITAVKSFIVQAPSILNACDNMIFNGDFKVRIELSIHYNPIQYGNRYFQYNICIALKVVVIILYRIVM